MPPKKRAVITTPMPTPEQVADSLGVSKARQAELFKMVEYAPTGPIEDVVFIRTDNAIAMYLRGQLQTDGVFLSRENILNALGITHSTFDADDLWWSEQAGALFPAHLKNVVMMKEE